MSEAELSIATVKMRVPTADRQFYDNSEENEAQNSIATALTAAAKPIRADENAGYSKPAEASEAQNSIATALTSAAKPTSMPIDINVEEKKAIEQRENMVNKIK